MPKGIAGQNINSGIAGMTGINTSNFNTGLGLGGSGFNNIPVPTFTPPPPELTTTLAPPPAAPAAPTAPSSLAQNTAPAAPTGPPANALPTGLSFAASGPAYQNYLQWASSVGITPKDKLSWYNGDLGIPAGAAPPTVAPPPPAGVGLPIPVDAPAFNSLAFFQQHQQQLLENALGREINPNPRFFDPDSRGNLFEFASGQFGGGSLGLPGQGADQTGDFIVSQLISEAAKQAGRSGEQEDILRSLIGQSAGSGANQTSNAVQQMLQGLVAPGALDALQAQRTQDLNQNIAAADNAGANRLRDLGFAGQGAAGANPFSALTNNLARTRQQGLLDISNQGEQDLLRRSQVAGQGAAQGADIFRALQSSPQLTLAQRLGQAENPAIAALIDQLGGFLNLQAGQALSQRGGSLFDDISPLLGAGIGAIGNIGAASQIAGSGASSGGVNDLMKVLMNFAN